MKNTIKRIGMIFAVVIMTVSLFSIISAAVSYPGHEHHYITFHGAVEATGCTDGKTGRAYCEACSIWIRESEIIPAPHYPGKLEIVDVVKDCEDGYRLWKKCTVCKVILEQKIVYEHDYEIIYTVPQPYCDVEVAVTKECKVCAKTSYETLPAQLHSWGNDPDGDWEIIREKTCTSDGLLRRYCKNCPRTEEKLIPATGHKYRIKFSGIAPTCTEEGRTAVRQCESCGDIQGGEILSKLPHKDDNSDYFCDRCEELMPGTSFTEGYYSYTIKKDGATIINVDTSISGDIVIPSTLGGYPVTEIGDGAFEGCIYITSVTIPEGVTSIGEVSFGFCVRLKNIVLPESLETIDNGAFGFCLSLEEINLPKKVVVINDEAFAECKSLKEFVVSNSDVSFGDYVAHVQIMPKDISIEQWIEKYITGYEAYLNGDENLENLEEDLMLHSEFIEEAIAIPGLTIYSLDPSTAKTYAEENGIRFELISEDDFKENEIITDDNTNVEIEFDNSTFETEVELIVSEEEVNANIVFGDEFENYKAYDISIVADGEKVQPDGYVTVKLPLPEGFNAETTAVYYVDDNGNKTKLESKVENGFVVFETDHFSEYVLVDESSKIKPPHEHLYTATITKNPTCTETGVKTYTCSCNDSYTEKIAATGHNFDGSECKNCDFDKADDCSCDCHAGGIKAFFFKLINFFAKIFDKSARVCECGKSH